MYSRRVAIRKKRGERGRSDSMKIFRIARRLPFEIASECTKFPPWHRSNYKIRATKFPLLNLIRITSAPTFEKLKRRVRFIDRDRSLPSYPTLGHATPKKGSFDSLGEKRERGDGRFEDLCARQRRAFQRPFSGRPSAARSVSSRRCDEHVNYYRQGSLAELQWR